MSEYLGHTIVFDDSARLAQLSDRVATPLKEALRTYRDAGRLGSATRRGKFFTVPLLTTLRERHAAGSAREDDGAGLAFALGWLAHRVADDTLKPVYRALQPDHYKEDRPSPPDVSIYHDVVLFREATGNGQMPPFSPSLIAFNQHTHPAAGAISVAETEQLVDALVQQELFALHSQTAGASFEDRLTLYFERVEPVYIDLSRYAEVAATPDAEFYRKFIVEGDFYDPDDPLIRLARSLQAGTPDPDLQLDDAMAAADGGGSAYAQILAGSLRLFYTASDFFEGRYTPEEAEAALFGRPDEDESE